MVTQTNRHRLIKYAILLFISFIAVYIRYLGRDVLSDDIKNCVTGWYNELVSAGPGLNSLLNYTGDYAMPYVFLIWLISKSSLPLIYSIKIIHALFDFGLAVVMGKIIKYFRPENDNSFCWGYCITLLLPNVFLNSCYWGQCDVIYTFFLFAAFLSFLYKKYPIVMIFFGIALSVKLQSVFFLPFLLIAYWLLKEFSVLQFLIVPVVMLVMNIPAMIAGYSPLITFAAYNRQINGYPWLYYFYPNLYFFFQARPYYLFGSGAILLTVTAFLIFVVLLVEKKVELNRENMVPILLWTAYTCTFFLPTMHERYGYFAEMIAVILGILNFRRSWVPIGMLLCILPKYLSALYVIENSSAIQMVTAVGNTCLYVVFTCILWHGLFQEERSGIHVED